MQNFCTCAGAVQASFQLHNHDAESESAAHQESGGGVTSTGITMKNNPAYQLKEEEV